MDISKIEITPERYHKLLSRGKEIFRSIGSEVNVLSDVYARDVEEWRRESDFNEMCIALAILEEKIKRPSGNSA